MQNKNFYDVLGVGRRATAQQIKAAYRKLASKLHPDRGGSTEDMTAVNQAYGTLKDAAKRARYDEKLAREEVKAKTQAKPKQEPPKQEPPKQEPPKAKQEAPKQEPPKAKQEAKQQDQDDGMTATMRMKIEIERIKAQAKLDAERIKAQAKLDAEKIKAASKAYTDDKRYAKASVFDFSELNYKAFNRLCACCRGRGFITVAGEDDLEEITCPECQGTGIKQATRV